MLLEPHGEYYAKYLWKPESSLAESWEFCKVSWQDLEFYIDHAHLDSHDLFLRPGGAFCYCSASMRAFLATWQMVQALISWISTRKRPRVGSDQGYPPNEEKLLPSIWHGFQGRSSRNKKRGSILMLLYLPFPRHGNSTFSSQETEIKAAIVISTLDACKSLQIMGYTMNYGHQPGWTNGSAEFIHQQSSDSDSLVVFAGLAHFGCGNLSFGSDFDSHCEASSIQGRDIRMSRLNGKLDSYHLNHPDAVGTVLWGSWAGWLEVGKQT